MLLAQICRLSFYCHEFYHKKKKALELGTDTKAILIGCESCKEGKKNIELERQRKQYQRGLRNQNIKLIIEVSDLFDDFARHGVPGTVTFCNRLDPIGTAMKKITCSKYNTQVELEKVCKDPRCEHLEQYDLRMHTEFPSMLKQLVEGLVEDNELIEDLSSRKNVEAEQV